MDAASPDSSAAFSLAWHLYFVTLICASPFGVYRVFAGKVEDYQGGLLMLKTLQ